MIYNPKSDSDKKTIDIDTDSQMTSDRNNFYLVNKISVKLDGEVFFQKRFDEAVERNFV